MERNAYKLLLEWKNTPARKPLILEGARQVGKTWLLKEFGSKEYKKMVYVNCDNNPMLEGLFSDYDISRIIRFLSAIYEVEIDTKDTLIIFDEIQEIARGLPALKYFNENSDYQVIVAGSLLGISMHEGTGFPVGNVDIIHLYPLSFEEFLLANHRDGLVTLMKEHNWSELSKMSTIFIELLRQYYFVGGMPAAVLEYVTTQNIFQVRKIHSAILESYRLDISKHAPKTDIPKINMVWSSLPAQLAKENKKFIYGALKKGGRAKEFENAIEWLINAGLVYKVNRVKKLDKPLKFYEDFDGFKLFASDLGLLGAMAEAPAKDILTGNKGFVEYKGAFTKQYIAQEYISHDMNRLYYYTNENSSLELDFVFQSDVVCIVEVKAEENLRSKSLMTSLRDREDMLGYRFSMSDYREQGKMQNIPLYLAGEWFLSVKENVGNP